MDRKYFYQLANREERELLPGIRARTFWGENMLTAVVELDPDTTMPVHSHPHEQVGILLSGSMDLTIDGETRTLHPGDVYVIPGGVEHGAKTGKVPAQVMDVFNPVREEYKY